MGDTLSSGGLPTELEDPFLFWFQEVRDMKFDLIEGGKGSKAKGRNGQSRLINERGGMHNTSTKVESR